MILAEKQDIQNETLALIIYLIGGTLNQTQSCCCVMLNYLDLKL